MTTADSASRTKSRLTVAFCVVAALAEGINLVSAGIAAPGVAMEFGLDKAQVGGFASFSTLGLLFGAAIGGRLADRAGRKAVLLWSLAIFGVFSLATAYAWDYPSMLAVRFLTGLGLGGAMANLVALSSEAAPDYQGTAVGLVYMGIPIGSTIIALIGSTITLPEWRTVFYVGGFVPLIVVPLLAFALPESSAFESSKARGAQEKVSTFNALFGGGRTLTTILLWIGFFFVQLAIYLVLSWLPTFLHDQGFDQHQNGLIQSAFSIGSVIGTAGFGVLLDRFNRRAVAIVAFVCAVAAQFSLSAVSGFGPVAAAAFAAGLFLVAAQLILLSAAPLCYDTAIRGRGVGAAVAAGRLGGYVGPQTAGFVLASGIGGNIVLFASVPGLLLAAITTLAILFRPAAGQQT
jgi:AAHS family 3-hydroxyphenylpropionic acid transporter